MTKTSFTSGTHDCKLSVVVRHSLHSHWSNKEWIGQAAPWHRQKSLT